MAAVTICSDFGVPPPKIKSVTLSLVSPSICHEVILDCKYYSTCFQVKFVQLGANSEVASVILVMIYFFSWVVDTQVFT